MFTVLNNYSGMIFSVIKVEENLWGATWIAKWMKELDLQSNKEIQLGFTFLIMEKRSITMKGAPESQSLTEIALIYEEGVTQKTTP